MAATMAMEEYKGFEEIKWTPMVVLSVFFHIISFIGIIILPDSIPSRSLKGTVYEVNLVELPGGGGELTDTVKAVPKDSSSGIAVAKMDSQAKRIQSTPTETENKPLVIAKRTTKKKSTIRNKPTVSPSQLIDKAISRIEKALKTDNSDHINSALSELQRKSAGDGETGGQTSRGEGGSITGLPIRIYQMEVENRIKGNWSYPVAADDKKKLEALVIIRVKRDGTILNSQFKKTSSDRVFDQSVIKAIERSNPLPPFPEGYRRSYDDIEINFNLKDLI